MEYWGRTGNDDFSIYTQDYQTESNAYFTALDISSLKSIWGENTAPSLLHPNPTPYSYPTPSSTPIT